MERHTVTVEVTRNGYNIVERYEGRIVKVAYTYPLTVDVAFVLAVAEQMAEVYGAVA